MIELVIKIPEQLVEIAQRELVMGGDMPTIANAISNGVVLPKGHGRLIDANELCEGRVSNDAVVIAAECAQTIIEADKGRGNKE